MTMLDKSALQEAISRLDSVMKAQFDVLNEADGKLGDGDLGITMTRGMAAIIDIADDLPADLGVAILKCAQAFTKTSGSSFGTLMALALMAIAKEIKGQTAIQPADISALVTIARDQIQTRGKAEIGGKTVLDSLDAIVHSTADLSTLDHVKEKAVVAVDAALEKLRHKPASIGRAGMFVEKSIGLDDPGMLAMKYCVYAITGRLG